MRPNHARRLVLEIALLLLTSFPPAAPAGPAAPPPPLFVRVTLLSPSDRPWRVHVIAQWPGGKSKSVFAGKVVADTDKGGEPLPPGQPTGWLDLSDALSSGSPDGATLRFLFDAPPATEKAGDKPGATAGVEAKIDVASAADESTILRSVTDHDPGNVISVRIPSDPTGNKDRILSVREDARRRLEEVKALSLPDGPLPRKIWCMTGFRSNGEFYTDPAIAATDFEIIRRLGMNGFWEQNGGQPGALRKMAGANGLDRSTVYWRSVESLPRDNGLDGATRLDWGALDVFLDKVYRQGIDDTRKRHPDGMPEIIADLMDEPDGLHFDGPEYREEFRSYLRLQNLSPQQFGKQDWAQVAPIVLRWRTFFEQRDRLDLKDEPTRRLLYWSAKFWNHSTARAYSLATRKVERYAPGTATRLNFGPPWWYDYGTLPRGIDAFEFGRLRGVTLGFNEDWVGKGNPRVPLEIDTLLMDWSRAAARPATPLLGSYVTRDSDRATVKLRAFACLAREAKIFDFYYYGPAYTFFDHWSDNASMVRGVGELTRDLGAADDALWDGRAPKAEAALLYSQSWPVWKEDDTEQCEQMMAYVALLHAGIPVDIVSDAEVSDGRFAAGRYKCLYVVNESVPAAAAAEIERWVRGGGRLWASGWAGARDEYNTPSEGWNEMLGVRSRSWKQTGDAAAMKRLGQAIRPDDWTRPIFGREVTIAPLEGGDPRTPGAAGPGAPKAHRRRHGAGLVQVVPWAAGKDYMDGAREIAGPLAKATLYPEDARRGVYADFALEAGARPPATTSASQVLAWPLWSQGKGVILLANYTGEPVARLRVTFTTPLGVVRARSLRHGELELTRPGPDQMELSLPMEDVTDVVTVN